MTAPIFGIDAEATYEEFCEALGVASVAGWRAYLTPSQGIPSAWPGGGNTIPSGVTFPVVSLKPDISAVLSGALDAALAAYFALVPAGAAVTLWHEGEHSAGVSANTLIAMHAHVYPIFHANAAAGAMYVQIFETFTAYTASSHYPLSQWVCSVANGGVNLDGYFLDWYPNTTATDAVDSITPAVTQVRSVTTSPVIGVTECNYTTDLTGGITWTGTPAQWFSDAWAYALANNLYCFFPYFNATNGVPFPGADSDDVVAELSLINQQSGGSPATATYLIATDASAAGSKTVVVPVANSTSQGDAIVVGASVVVTSETVTSVEDSQGNSYILAESITTEFAMSVFVATSGSGPDEPTIALVAGTDTITVNFSTTGTNAKNIIAAGIPGILVGAFPDQVASAFSAGSNSPVALTGVLETPAEACVAFVTNGASGADIAWANPWVSIAGGVQQSTNAISGMAAQTVITPNPVIASGTISASTKWALIVVTLPVVTPSGPIAPPSPAGTGTDSLILAGAIELLGNLPTYGCIPGAPGAGIFTDPDFSFGSPQPVVDQSESLVTDGEMPYGTRASNRTFVMPLTIFGSTRQEVAVAEEYLMALIDQPSWTLLWTRSDVITPLVWDCFRAEPSEPTYDLAASNQVTAFLKITFQALPYGRSSVQKLLGFAAPISGASAPPSPVVVDSFSSVSGPQWVKTTFSTAPGSTNAAQWTQGNLGFAEYTKTLGSVADIEPLSSIAFWCAFVVPLNSPANQVVTFIVQITDSHGNTLQFGQSQKVDGCLYIATPKWNYVSIPVKQVKSGFIYSAVKKYEIVIATTLGKLSYQNYLMTEIVAKPESTQLVAGTRGAVYNLDGILGSVHAPVSFQFQQPALASFSTLIAHRPGQNASPSLVPYVSVGGGSDTPDGTHFYTFSSLISGVNALFTSTYTILLIADSFSSPTDSRKVTVTFYQYPFSGSSNPVTQTVSRTFTPSTDIVNGIVEVGAITLPVADIAPDNTQAQFKATVTDTVTTDRYFDVIALDTLGQTVIVNTNDGDFENIWIDEPDLHADLGRVLGSASDRGSAFSVLALPGPPEGPLTISGGPLTVDPGDNLLFCYCVEGPPGISAAYYPQFYLDSII
jgi:hypothetical protein